MNSAREWIKHKIELQEIKCEFNVILKTCKYGQGMYALQVSILKATIH